MTIPQGRLRRTAPLAAISARAAGEGVVNVLRRRLKGKRGASLDFHLRNAERYADALSRSKGVLMKVGQILSFVDTSAALDGQYGEVYRSALASLQADAEPMEPVLVAAVIESELGRPPEQLFAEFSPEPIAAASIGQVHAARLHDGSEVAVKVQYPGVADAMRDDLANTQLLFTFVKIAKGVVPQYRNFDVRAVSDEIAKRMGPAVQQGFFDFHAAAMDNDAERLLQVWIDNGFTSADSPPPADKVLAWSRGNFAAFHQPQPFTFTPEFVSELLGHMASMDKDVMRHVTVPRDFVFTNRIFVGLFSILGALRATADWRAIFQEHLTGQPTTELGRLEADFFAAKSDA